MTPQARILRCAEQAFSVELADRIDEAVNLRVIALAENLENDPPDGLIETVPTYRSLLVRFDPARICGQKMAQVLRDRLAQSGKPARNAGTLWRLPAVYGGEAGLDLDDLARQKAMSPEQIIALHCSVTYRIYMIGFSPGFAYLGGLPEVLHTPRLSEPRPNIPAGAIGIGGRQGSINAVAGPSGWRFIAWTPVRTFAPHQPAPFLLRAGDLVRFVPISAREGAALVRRRDRGETIVLPENCA